MLGKRIATVNKNILTSIVTFGKKERKKKRARANEREGGRTRGRARERAREREKEREEIEKELDEKMVLRVLRYALVSLVFTPATRGSRELILRAVSERVIILAVVDFVLSSVSPYSPCRD